MVLCSRPADRQSKIKLFVPLRPANASQKRLDLRKIKDKLQNAPLANYLLNEHTHIERRTEDCSVFKQTQKSIQITILIFIVQWFYLVFLCREKNVKKTPIFNIALCLTVYLPFIHCK